MGTEYRNYVSVFIIALFVKVLFIWPIVKNFATEYSKIIILILGLLLFLFSYKKQVTYISSRIKTLNNN